MPVLDPTATFVHTVVNQSLVTSITPPAPIEASLGISGAEKISTDAENRLTRGNDSGLYVPECVSDPLAYYILARN